jgi:hypothetical protein
MQSFIVIASFFHFGACEQLEDLGIKIDGECLEMMDYLVN